MVDGAVRPDLTRVMNIIVPGVLPDSGMNPVAFKRFVPGGPGVSRPRTMISGRPGHEHARTNRPHLIETPLQHDVIEMPLANDVRMVPCIAQCLAPQGRGISLSIRAKSSKAC